MEWLLPILLQAVFVAFIDSFSTSDNSNKLIYTGTGRGQWSAWQYWTPCSRSCDGGLSTRARSCYVGNRQVEPQNCNGEPRQYMTCNNQPCQGGHVNFRAIQCSMYDELDQYGVVRQWRPINNLNNDCDLFCEKQVSATESLSRNMGIVVDGTHCFGTSGPGLCIQGECRNVGCDGRLDSNVQYDNCGECGGNDRSCGLMSGTFRIQLAEEELFHYYDVVTFQPGTRNITVEESSEVNYLALSVDNIFYLNGDWDIDLPGVFAAAGALFTYERRRDGYEQITSPGPVNSLVQISIIVRSINPLVRYQFHQPANPNPSRPTSTAPSYNNNTVMLSTEKTKISDTCPCMSNGVGESGSIEDSKESDLTDNLQSVIDAQEARMEAKIREKKQKQEKKEQIKDLCGPCEKVKGKIRNFCKSDFVVRANILDRAVEFNMTRYDIEILQTFTNHVALFPREYIWVPNICNCPKIKTGREYLIMGNRVQTSHENLLMVDRDKMVIRWKPENYDMWDSIQSTSNTKCHKLRLKHRKKKHK